MKASERALDAGKMDYQDARDLIVRAIAALYLNAQSAAARVDAAQSRVTDSSALFKLAKDKHDAGTATGVDVLRAQVQLANDKQALLIAENQFKQSLLELARNLGMSPGTPLELAEPLRYQPLNAAGDLRRLRPRRCRRAPIISRLTSQRAGAGRAAERQPRAFLSEAEHQWKLSARLGAASAACRRTGLMQGQIDFTLFDRDRNGEAQELASRVKRIDDQIADLRRGIEEDIARGAAESGFRSRAGDRGARRPGAGAARIANGAGSLSVGHGQQCRSGYRAGRTGARRRELHSCRLPAMWTRSLRWPAPWAIRRRTLLQFMGNPLTAVIRQQSGIA